MEEHVAETDDCDIESSTESMSSASMIHDQLSQTVERDLLLVIFCFFSF